MAKEDILSDEYVANLLAKDAKESSIKYSALGMEGFASKPPSTKPKPNTRFLRNIIKETDTHNAALLAKEAAESRARLEGLVDKERRPNKVAGGDIRKRQLGDIAAILGGGSRKRRKPDDDGRSEKRRKNTSSAGEEPGTRSEDRAKRRHEPGTRDETKFRSHTSHRSRRERSTSRTRDRDGERLKDRSRSRSPKEHRNEESRHRHRSPKRRRSRSPENRSIDLIRSHKPRSAFDAKRDPERLKKKVERQPDSDSDPLDDIIGPRPPKASDVKSRGRGTISAASGIDSRFSANYDPKSDVQLDPDEENDWDQALEALRDRTKWKQQGADRLRAAGFTEEEIVKWEKGGEKTVEDVKWTKKGEGREWDRGKVMTEEGSVSFDANFGRLKDESGMDE